MILAPSNSTLEIRPKVKADLCVVGALTRDINRAGGRRSEMIGGSAYYTATALRGLGARVSVVTKVAGGDKALVDSLTRNGIEVTSFESSQTTVFENIYPEGMTSRSQKVLARMDPFTVRELSGITSRIVHLGPILQDDIPLEAFRRLSKKAVLSLDVQGLLRATDGEQVGQGDWVGKEEGLAHIRILKADETEARALVGNCKLAHVAARLAELGPKEVIITRAEAGSVVWCEGTLHSIPAFLPRRMVDVTGCGDTFMAGYLFQRINCRGVIEAATFASALAAMKIEGAGAVRWNERAVCDFLESRPRLPIPAS